MLCKLFKLLAGFFCDCEGCKDGPLHIVYQSSGFTIEGFTMINLASGASINLGLTLDPDAAGNPTTLLPGVVAWTSSDATKGTLAPSADGLTCGLNGLAVGTFQVTATSGALTSTIDVTVTAGVTTGIHIVELPATPAAEPAAPAAQ